MPAKKRTKNARPEHDDVEDVRKSDDGREPVYPVRNLQSWLTRDLRSNDVGDRLRALAGL